MLRSEKSQGFHREEWVESEITGSHLSSILNNFWKLIWSTRPLTDATNINWQGWFCPKFCQTEYQFKVSASDAVTLTIEDEVVVIIYFSVLQINVFDKKD